MYYTSHDELTRSLNILSLVLSLFCHQLTFIL